ncbi:MAG TPA: VC0807 family protein, partial [Streptosporangiaceae bacterium]|nr:VC0807 family protein [Streptosporangiaceae bacterium]
MAATQTQNRETVPMPGRRDQVPADAAPAGGAPTDGAPTIGALADGAVADREAANHAPAGRAPAGRRPDLAGALRPLLIDIGIPVGTYYLLRDAFGVSLWLSLALSSVGPAVRSIAGLVAERKLNLLAVLMLAVNLAGIGISFLTGDPRAMIAKDSIVSSVIAFAIL